MAFTLRIRFTGLCLFVPDTTGARMHVLMPDTTGMSGMEHEVKLEHNAHVVGDPVPKRLENLALEFGGLTGGVHLPLPDEIVNLSPITGAKVELSSPGKIISKVTLEAGRVSHRKGLGKWQFPPDPQHPHLPSPVVHMANWALWTVHVPGTELVLGTSPLGGGPAQTTALKPAQDNLICLTVSHLPANEKYFVPSLRYEPGHFHAFFHCLSGGQHRKPELVGKGWIPAVEVSQEETDHRCVPIDRRSRGIAYSCMIASADPE